MDECNNFSAQNVKSILGGSGSDKPCLLLKKTKKKSAVKNPAKTKSFHSIFALFSIQQFLSDKFYLTIDLECQSSNLITIN
jgi:hypothetical protein